MNQAALLYPGATAHLRLQPFERSFRYRIASLLIDIERLDEAARASRLFSVNRFNLFSFHERDHGRRDGSSLREWAQEAFATAGVDLDGGAIRLLCFPRVLGYVFNPLSLWFGYGPDGALRGVIYAVRNTFDGAHAYVAAAQETDTHRHWAEKVFHVSPFFPSSGRYDFTLNPPGERFTLKIDYAIDGERQFIATQSGRARTLSSRSLLSLFFSMPLMTLKVIGAIHWEALLIWRRGAKYRSPPEEPAPVSLAHPLDAALSGETRDGESASADRLHNTGEEYRSTP